MDPTIPTTVSPSQAVLRAQQKQKQPEQIERPLSDRAYVNSYEAARAKQHNADVVCNPYPSSSFEHDS